MTTSRFGDITVAELIQRLQMVPGDWFVSGTNSGSLVAGESEFKDFGPAGSEFVRIFTDQREPMFLTRRSA